MRSRANLPSPVEAPFDWPGSRRAQGALPRDVRRSAAFLGDVLPGCELGVRTPPPGEGPAAAAASSRLPAASRPGTGSLKERAYGWRRRKRACGWPTGGLFRPRKTWQLVYEPLGVRASILTDPSRPGLTERDLAHCHVERTPLFIRVLIWPWHHACFKPKKDRRFSRHPLLMVSKRCRHPAAGRASLPAGPPTAT